MRLDDTIKNIQLGYLINTSFGEEDLRDMKAETLRRFIFYINNALLELHTRFPLKSNFLYLRSLSHLSEYRLHSDHALSSHVKAIKYILDTPRKPFKNDIIKITTVTNQVGDPLPINNSEQWASVFTPEYDLLQLNHPSDGQVFEVHYRAKHAEIKLLENLNDLYAQIIILPPPLVEAFKIKVASEFFESLSGQENSAKANELKARYESIMDSVVFEDRVSISNQPTNVKLHRRGFP